MAHYIDAAKLLEEVEQLCSIAIDAYTNSRNHTDFWDGRVAAYQDIVDVIANLQQEQPIKGYDENYINEKIAKASKTWENVDVDKYMDEVRGREQEQPRVDLKKEIEKGWEKLEKDYSPSALDKSYIIVSGMVGEKQFSRIARHFFELGLKAKEESK